MYRRKIIKDVKSIFKDNLARVKYNYFVYTIVECKHKLLQYMQI